MKRLLLLGSILMVLVLAACSAQSQEQQTAVDGDGPVVTVYRPPT
jgi:uncharacterized lipoprotein